MKVYFYYVRTLESNKPMITHAFAVSGDEYARGTAICSFGDNPCKKTGRQLAEVRAKQALRNKLSFQNDLPVVNHNHPGPFNFFKGEYMPELEPIEEKFVQNYKNQWR